MPKPKARRGVAGTVTITLEDHGQDFTEMDVDLERMAISDVRPYQSWIWNEAVIRNSVLRRGMRLVMRTKNGNRDMQLRYPIDQVGPVVPKSGALL